MDSLNDIRLTPQMIEALYGQSLVSPADHTVVKKAAPEPSVGLKTLGNNNRHITILVNSPDHAFLPEKELSFLVKMLDACKLNLADVAIVNSAGKTLNMHQLVEQLSPSTILYFGEKQDKPLFAILDETGFKSVYAPSLSELSSNSTEAKTLKTRLWNVLKQLFEL